MATLSMLPLSAAAAVLASMRAQTNGSFAASESSRPQGSANMSLCILLVHGLALTCECGDEMQPLLEEVARMRALPPVERAAHVAGLKQEVEKQRRWDLNSDVDILCHAGTQRRPAFSS